MSSDEPLFAIPKDYLYTIGATLLMGTHYIVLGLLTSVTRAKYFPQSWMEEKFGKEHEAAFGEKIRGGGYPDIGEGRYAKALGLQKWEEFNNAFRGFQNYKENITMYIGITLLTGLYFPLFAAGGCAALAAGRILYAIGYSCKGANSRLPGAMITLLSFIALVGGGIYGSIKSMVD